MPGLYQRVYVARCAQCTRGLYRKPDAEHEGRCESCRRYNQKWALWLDQAASQADHNRQRAGSAGGLSLLSASPEPAQLGGEES